MISEVLMSATFSQLLVGSWDATPPNLGLKTNLNLAFRGFAQSYQKFATIVFKLHHVRFFSYYLQMSNRPTTYILLQSTWLDDYI